MTSDGVTTGWDAVVVAGGASRRMGGGDKLMLDVAGRSLLDRVLGALADAGRVVVVGPERVTCRDVRWCVEEPPGGGPAAALRAGLDHVGNDLVVVLAADQPFVDAAAIGQLLSAVVADGAVAVDGEGQPQWLLSAWRANALRRAELRAHGSLRRALTPLDWEPVRVNARLALDCDTPDDLRRARELAT